MPSGTTSGTISSHRKPISSTTAAPARIRHNGLRSFRPRRRSPSTSPTPAAGAPGWRTACSTPAPCSIPWRWSGNRGKPTKCSPAGFSTESSAVRRSTADRVLLPAASRRTTGGAVTATPPAISFRWRSTASGDIGASFETLRRPIGSRRATFCGASRSSAKPV